ncbi:MAG TPA: UdgX family uracil-DNA binding protein [bacterium]|nr:UdgX family uracil-DNA binding protein [bacterium]
MKESTDRSAADFLPKTHSLTALRAAAASCQGCDLYQRATQTVFGEGPVRARIVFVGEVPGDYEDRQGHPFVGPAGRLLDKALEEIAMDRGDVYVTNAVKHFKWEQVGKRRKHKKPLASEIRACHPWLEAELAAIKPEVVVCLGKTAAEAVLERPVQLRKEQGSFVDGTNGAAVFITIHPSAILRFQEPEERDREYERFVAELRKVKRRIAH